MEAQSPSTPLGAPSSTLSHLTPTSTSKKRNYEGKFVTVASSITPPLDHQSSPVTATRSRSGTPASSPPGTPLTDLGTTPVLSPSQSAMAPTDSKKRKLTFAEREVEKAVKRREKEEREKQKEEREKEKAEAKARKDDEKKRRDEEKDAARRAKEALKEEKQKQKDAVKQEKDAVKQEKDAEKERKAVEVLKKERVSSSLVLSPPLLTIQSQMRIGAFFGQPPSAATPPTSPDDVSVGTMSRRSSIASIDMEQPEIEIALRKPTNPDYSNWILPFFVNEHMELAPFNRFHTKTSPHQDRDLPLYQQINLDTRISSQFRNRRRVVRIKPVREIMEHMNALTDAGVELTTIAPLASVPYKYFFFHQDIRPAYQGTYTKAISPRSARKIALKPYHRGLPDTDYDYDSEAEWQEPEEGDDDLMDEDEKSEDEDGEDEMDDFLDDEGEVMKRQMLVSDMIPKSSGLCWEGSGRQQQDGIDLSAYRMDVLHDSTTFPIEPYSSQHWSDIGKTNPNKRCHSQTSAIHPSMQPPRLPLTAVDGNGGITPASTLLGFVSGSGQSENKTQHPKLKATKNAASGKPAKMVAEDVLSSFKDAISGSTLTKIGLIEVLKQQFPKCSKDAIKNTLETVAVRQGGKEVEKKWVLVD